MPPNLGRQRRARWSRRSTSGDAGRVGARHRGGAGCCGWSSWPRRRWRGQPPVDADAHHALARAGRRPSAAVLLKNDGGLLPLDLPTGADGGRDRRVRAYAALPGRRQLAGQPDPARRAARRAARRRSATVSRCGSPPGSASATTEERRRRCSRGASTLAGGADTVVVFLGLARRGRVRGLRPDPHRSAAPTRLACWMRSPGCASRWSSCWPTARSSGCPLGAQGGRRSWSAGCPARRPAEQPPTCCSAPRTRRASWPRRSRVRLEDNPSYLNFPGDSRGPLRRGRLHRLPRL